LIGGLCAALLYFGVFIAPGARDLFAFDIFPKLPFTSEPWQLARWWSESAVVDAVSLVVAGDDAEAKAAAKTATPGKSRAPAESTAHAATVSATRRSLLPSETAALALLIIVLAAGFASRRTFARAAEPHAWARPSVGARQYGFLVITAVCA